jgi:hypothetical protein
MFGELVQNGVIRLEKEPVLRLRRPSQQLGYWLMPGFGCMRH